MKCLLLLISFIMSSSSFAFFERKQEQFQTTPSYIISPAPYQLPGVGSGWIFYARANNIALNYLDISAYSFTGAANGYGFGLHELHIIPEFFYIGTEMQKIRSTSIQAFNDRGMQNSADEFTHLYGEDILDQNLFANITFWNRRVNLSYKNKNRSYFLETIETNDDQTLSKLDFEKEEVLQKAQVYNFELDLTNDFQDPTFGFRTNLTYIQPDNKQNLSDSEYHVISQSYNLYIPVLEHSTIALNYFKSDAYVDKVGTTDTDAIRTRLGLPSCSGDSNCEDAQQNLVNRVLAENQFGSATALGGRNRLRGFPMNRFVGSHSIFYAAEFRWNLSSEVLPFNYFLIKDTRSALQLAFFYEKGASSDEEETLSEQLASTQGAGIRIVTKSGFVFRFDWGNSNEGNEYIVIGSYPW